MQQQQTDIAQGAEDPGRSQIARSRIIVKQLVFPIEYDELTFGFPAISCRWTNAVDQMAGRCRLEVKMPARPPGRHLASSSSFSSTKNRHPQLPATREK